MADGTTAPGRSFRFAFGEGRAEPTPSAAEAAYLRLGLDQPGRKLPLFDRRGQAIRRQVIHACLARGWAERWFANPLAPDWLVCRLTEAGVRVASRPRRGA
jgi:hypothetical protein